ncbi:MAG: serine hydrolase [Gemmatimonadaceae bacterium]|nr:serine hydrolase [Gemmatimonadaceae bacterium]
MTRLVLALACVSIAVTPRLAAIGQGGLARHPARAPISHQRQARQIDSLAREAVTSRRLASVSIGVVQGPDTILLRAWGDASHRPTRPATPATVYRLASLTKQFTSAIILQLIAEQRLALTDTLGKFLPWVPASWRGVTIQQLLNHTSGIPSYTSLGAPWVARWAEDMSPDTIIALTAGRPLDFAPGSGWRYDNTGYVILGRLIELLDNRPYAASVASRIAQPLGLTTLRYCPTVPIPPRDAVGTEAAPGKTFRPAAALSLTQPFAAGALCASAGELIRWNVALHGGHVVTAPLYLRMTTPEGAARTTHYGFGIGRDSTGGRLRYTHSGGINGFATSNSFWPDSALSVVVLANTEGNEVDALAEQIRRVLMGEPLVPRPKPIALTRAQLSAHAGRYELTLPSRTIGLTVRVAGAYLLATFDGDSPTTMVPIAAHRFMSEQDANTQLVFALTDGHVTGITLESGPQKFTGRRVGDAP